MTDPSLPARVTEPLESFERALESAASSFAEAPNLNDAIRYALLGGGKRIRPLLCLHACAAAGAPLDRATPAAISVELVHAFSLVHDDLPALDDDDLRRGRPTLHIHTSEAMAILAGDAMLAAAFAHLQRETPPTLAPALTAELANATAAMIDGQVYDTLGGLDDTLHSEDRLRRIHRAKTGALIRAAMRMGAVTAIGPDQPDHPAIAALTRCADALGLMFQVIDDLLDAESTPEQTGKQTRKDADAGKLTFPSVLGAQTSRNIVQDLRLDAIHALEPLGPAADPLRDLADFLAVRTH